MKNLTIKTKLYYPVKISYIYDLFGKIDSEMINLDIIWFKNKILNFSNIKKWGYNNEFLFLFCGDEQISSYVIFFKDIINFNKEQLIYLLKFNYGNNSFFKKDFYDKLYNEIIKLHNNHMKKYKNNGKVFIEADIKI